MEAHVRKLESEAPDARLLGERRERLRGELEEERRRLYAPGEMDPYRFGLIVRDLLVAEGLQIDRYQTLEAGKRTLLEFAVRGEARGMLAFLRRVSLSEHTWSVPYLSIGARERGWYNRYSGSTMRKSATGWIELPLLALAVALAALWLAPRPVRPCRRRR